MPYPMRELKGVLMSRADKVRRREKRKEKRQRTGMRPAGGGRSIQVQDYLVTCDPLEEKDPGVRGAGDALSEDEAERMYHRVHEEPEEAIPDLERLVEQHPDVPAFHNWLMAAYGMAGRLDDAKRTAALNYERNPSYLFARINHAQMLMEQGKLEEAVKVAANFSPPAIYPHRKMFHITEISAIGALAVEYYIKIREFAAAEVWIDTLESIVIDPGQLILLQMKLANAKSPGGLLERMMKLVTGKSADHGVK